MFARFGLVGSLLIVAAGHLGEHRASLRLNLATVAATPPATNIALNDGSNMFAITKNSSAGAAALLGERNKLYLCNNHQDGALQAWAGRERKLITTESVPRGACSEYVMPMYIGDVIHFEVGKASTRVYLPSEPVGDDGVVLFAVHQGPAPYNALLVKSTFFRRLVYPQVVALDVAYEGVSIADRVKLIHHGKPTENVLLTYEQVTPIDQGSYTVEMVDDKGNKEVSRLTAAMGATYVILRTGAAEVTVYPPAHSGVAAMSAGLAAWSLMLVARAM